MKNNLLIPNRYKVIGWMAFLTFAALGLVCMNLDPEVLGINFLKSESISYMREFTDEIAIIGLIISLLTIAFAKEKNEDEYIAYLRLKSWQWSVLASYAILILLTLLVYGMDFFNVLIYNMFTILLVFIIKFNWSLHQLKKEGLQNEK